MEEIDLKNSVIVCFLNFRKLPISELRNEQVSFLVSHNDEDLINFCYYSLNNSGGFDIDLSLFEFENYQEAFKYCIDLKESF